MKNIYSFIIVVLLFFATGCDNQKENEDKSPSSEIKDIVEKVSKPEVTEGMVKTDNVDLYYKTVGKGTPIIVLHAGPGLWHEYLVPYLEPLAENHKLIFLDQRGNGNSTFPKDSSFTFNDYVQDIKSVYDELKIEKASIIGHSFGGMLATLFASAHPDLVNKLVLVSPAPPTSMLFEKAFNNREHMRTEADTKKLVKLMSSKAFQKGDTSVFKEALLLADKVNVVDTNTIHEIFSHMHFTNQRDKNLLVIESIVEKNFWEMDISKDLSKVEAPTLIIHGNKDNIPLESDELYTEYLKNAQIKVIKDAGHYTFAEQPKDFLFAVQEFLK